MKAIIADIHGNLEALSAVLGDIADHNVCDIYCLGDIVGYGPNPRECVDLLAKCSVAVLGDHDLAAVGGQPPVTPQSQRLILWTRQQLAIPTPNSDESRIRREFLAGLPLSHREDDFLFLHGSPRDPVNEYLFPEDTYNRPKMEAVFALVDRYCFYGHTHIPGIINEKLEFIPPESTNFKWELDGHKTLCNVGSVGQPRDGDPRACYVLLDGNFVHFRRVDYDVESTIRKIKDRDDFP